MQKLKVSKDLQIKVIIFGFSFLCIIYAFLIQDSKSILEGLKNICASTAGLITDYYVVGGMGATLINCGLTTISCFIVYLLCKAKLDGMTIAVLFTLAGFSFFGKNILNIWPIILGSWFYALLFKIPFKSIINIALFATSLSPYVSEGYYFLNTDVILYNLLFAALVGIIIGLITPMIAKFTPNCHKGYNLYNSGFATGIVGMVFTAILNFFNHYVKMNISYSRSYTKESLIFVLCLSAFFLILYFIIDYQGIKKMLTLMKLKTRFSYDYFMKLDSSTAIINMTILGLFYTVLVLLLEVPLSGPAIGGIFTIIGFAATGKNLYNSFFIVIGIILFAEIGHIELTDITIILAFLFGTCLSPIVNEFGPFLGIISGIIHVCLVMNVSFLHSGLNLYNNGFAAGLVCIFVIPLFEALVERFPNVILWKKITVLERIEQI